MKNNFSKSVSLIFEENVKPSLMLLIEDDEERKKKKKPKNKSDLDFDMPGSEDGDLESDDSDVDDSDELESLDDESKGLNDETEKDTSSKDSALTAQMQAAVQNIDIADNIMNSREEASSKLINPLDSLIERSDKFNLINLLLEEEKDKEDNTAEDLVDKIDTFLNNNQDKITDLQTGIELNKKGFDFSFTKELNNSMAAIKDFNKKVSIPDLILYQYMKKIVDYAPIDEIEKTQDEFKKEFVKNVKSRFPKYKDYNDDSVYISKEADYNNAVGSNNSSAG